MKFYEHYGFRRKLVEQLELDLIGPTDPENTESIGDRPITKYAAGILFPQGEYHADLDTLIDEDIEDRSMVPESIPDPGLSMANVRYPSSMGMTFAVDTSVTDNITVSIDVARYEPDDTVERVRPRSTRHVSERWHRRGLSIEPDRVCVSVPDQRRVDLAENLKLYVRVRPADRRGVSSVTMALINTAQAPIGNERDSKSFFQPRITVSSATDSPAFVERSMPGTPDSDEELKSYKLLYRHAPTFAIGHGCAVEWDHVPSEINDVNTERAARSIHTTFVPTFDLRLADSNPRLSTPALGMHHLATAPDKEVRSSLRELTTGYRQWIEDRRSDAVRISNLELQSTAESHLAACTSACDRMDAGIRLLEGEVMDAFRLANRAMAMQRGRTDWLKQNSLVDEPDHKAGRWFPFQIAFILLSMGGVVDKDSEDHDSADVLWFPTGGGKTEAYLGLIAFTVFLRRIRNRRDGGGVTVLMRYTLRLLTVQQFERAALLVCCMENLRRDDPNQMGTAEISIGMWVGKASTPNSLKDAKVSLRRLQRHEEIQEENPVQIHSCPWCGRAMDYRNYVIGPNRMTVACGGTNCDFNDGLPVHVVDETIYSDRPTLIIATADKFAGIPWKDQVAQLFNLNGSEPPPELIIQDELHLISGPLGTLTGLYEAAIDLAADRPKIVASTATIRRATRQGNALFHRTVSQFPPPGIDSRDSFFSVEVPPETKASRLYVGLMTSATSQTSLLVRAYASLLHHANALPGSNETRDPYWTLLGYFNSLRLLAGARLQVHDDVTDRLELLAKQHTENEREIRSLIELNSREPSSAIPQRLKDMARALPDEPIDVILATNMISVGVDIDRLGLMVVMGQPQSTSEYIQATSRVGRKWPGLVVTLLNATRSRDRSHYENFTAYHSALYRQVEATSVTPFSARARDRGLHAVVIGLARLLIPRARPNDAASTIRIFEEDLRVLCHVVLDRVQAVAGTSEREAAEAQIDEIIRDWMRRADSEPDLVYQDRKSPGNGLLMDAGHYDESDDAKAGTMPTLWSLRDVDVESKLYLDRGTR